MIAERACFKSGCVPPTLSCTAPTIGEGRNSYRYAREISRGRVRANTGEPGPSAVEDLPRWCGLPKPNRRDLQLLASGNLGPFDMLSAALCTTGQRVPTLCRRREGPQHQHSEATWQ